MLGHAGLGGAMNDNFILWEYLASHGYVVATSAFLPRDGSDLSIGWDAERSVADLNAILRDAAGWANVVRGRVAVVGHSYGAQAALIFAMQSHQVDAVVSIDSTLENASRKDPFFERPRYKHYFNRPKELRVPTLLFAVPGERNTAFSTERSAPTGALCRCPTWLTTTS